MGAKVAKQELFEGDWYIDVWNCHGVLKREEWGLGYGFVPQPPLGLRFENIGWFTVPVPASTQLTKKQRKQIEEVLLQVVYRDGGINMSGLYHVTDKDLDRLTKIFAGQELEKAPTDEVAEKILKQLKKKRNWALCVHTSAWDWGCSEFCRGYHVERYIFHCDRGFMQFTIGAHHAWGPRMWDIRPHRISEREARKEVKQLVEYERRTEEIYTGEDEDFVDWVLYGIRKIIRTEDGYQFA